jgi:hypothetical protein
MEGPLEEEEEEEIILRLNLLLQTPPKELVRTFYHCGASQNVNSCCAVPKNETISTEMLAACTPTKFRV